MEARIALALATHNLTYLELLRSLAVDCDQFILFVRDKSFESNMTRWPAKYGAVMQWCSQCGMSCISYLRCGSIFSSTPIFSPLGTCFTTSPSLSLTATSTGVSERLTILLSSHSTIVKSANWLQDEALKTGIFFALSR